MSETRRRGTPSIHYERDDPFVTISLRADNVTLPVAEWQAHRKDARAVLGRIIAAYEDAKLDDAGNTLVQLHDGRVRLSPQFVAELDEADAKLLGLPPATALALSLRTVGRIDEDSFRIECRWVQPGGAPVRARVSGAFIETSSGARRIPGPLYRVHRAVLPLSEPVRDQARRYELLSAVHEAWPADARSAVESEAYLKDIRIHYASGLSLHLRELTPGKTTFDPLLVGRRAVSELAQSGRLADEDGDSLLPQSAQRLFAQDRFLRESDARSVYVLRNGEYVFIDPSLQPILGCVRKMAEASEAEKRTFVLAPHRTFREMLGPQLSNELDLDALFVETEQFSHRVAGVDVWTKPVLPWMKPLGRNSWLPEKFGVRVGDIYYEVRPDQIGPLCSAVRAAEHLGRGFAEVPEPLKAVEPADAPELATIPVTEQTMGAVNALEKFTLAGANGDAQDLRYNTDEVWDTSRGKLFLLVHENFEDVGYAAPPTPSKTPTTISLPSRLRTELKPHQAAGFEWLVRCHAAGRPGALLADDMGLGKTLQVITFLAYLQERRDGCSGPALVVAPTGLLQSWRNEILRHLETPHLGPLVLAFAGGLRALRDAGGLSLRDIDSGRAGLDVSAWRDAGIVLTTYETLRDYHFSFARSRFAVVVFDELHKAKNPTSQLSRATRTLNSEFAIGMTGTPVENRLQDLWSIMDVVAPGVLGASRDFERRYPAHDRVALASLKAQLMEGRDGEPPYMLRRLKADALEGLPEKRVERFRIEMPESQAAAYRTVVMRAAAARQSGSLGPGGMLSVLAEMRGVSLHPSDPRGSVTDLASFASQSARLSHTLAVLDKISRQNEKALIFVEDLAMQERLAAVIQERFKLPHLPSRISGEVPGPRRQALVDAFERNRDRFDVMILSPKAGGVGLTLISANHVIHLSRWWNPAVEDQATDRVFRIGQMRPVTVHVPMAVHPDPAISESSFDLRLDALLERKRKLTHDLFLSPEADDSEIAELFNEVSLESPPAGEDAAQANVARKPVASHDPPLPSTLARSGMRGWECQPGDPRPTQEILEIFGGAVISHVAISDPYALATTGARNAQVRFLAELRRSAAQLEAVTVEYAPDVDGQGHDGEWRLEFGRTFAAAMARPYPRMELRRRSKRGDGDFHDRSVRIESRSETGATQKHTLHIGRGLSALYDQRLQCTVIYTPA